MEKVAKAAATSGQRLTIDAHAKSGRVPLRGLAQMRGAAIRDFLVSREADPDRITVNTHEQSNTRIAIVTPIRVPHVYDPPQSYTDV
ncbi:hypothetical protein [Streptomyces sp. NPDC021356]|uniref:hypothetical protein n=1 Tax=Streptomyces sp. NPDC021356 TaxID=3154900 RepID=UPI0033D55961